MLGQRRSPASAAVKPKRSAGPCSGEGFLADGRHHLSRPRTSCCSCHLPDVASPLLRVVCRMFGTIEAAFDAGRCPEISPLPDDPNTLHLPSPVPVRAELSADSTVTSLHLQNLCNISNCTCADLERFSLRLSCLLIPPGNASRVPILVERHSCVFASQLVTTRSLILIPTPNHESAPSSPADIFPHRFPQRSVAPLK